MSRTKSTSGVRALATKSTTRAYAARTQMYTLAAEAADSLTVRFGNVVVKARAPDLNVSRKNIAAGQVALDRIKKVLVRPGVSVNLGRNVPLYRADPARPGFLIRTLNGAEQSGRFVGGRFKRA